MSDRLMFEPCPTCGGSGRDIPHFTNSKSMPCPDCVRGRVVSESVIEEMAEAIKDSGVPDYPDSDDVRDWARAAARVVLEHMEDNE